MVYGSHWIIQDDDMVVDCNYIQTTVYSVNKQLKTMDRYYRSYIIIYRNCMIIDRILNLGQ